MIIKSQAPCRLGLAGGGTDINPYVNAFGGQTISIAINIYQKFSLFTGIHIKGLNEVPKGCSISFVDAFRQEFKDYDNSFISESDGGIHSGIGSSAAIAVSIVGAFNKLKKLSLSKSEIAEKAWKIETQHLKMFGGKQDQYAAVYGGCNLFSFSKEGVTVLPFNANKIINSLVLLHTNKIRTSARIQESFKDLTKPKIRALNALKSLVTPTMDAITNGDIKGLGELLHESWIQKKISNDVSLDFITHSYAFAKSHGAYGGKVCGAGKGGFMLFVVDPNIKEDFIHKMELYGLTNWPFKIDEKGLEVKILMP